MSWSRWRQRTGRSRRRPRGGYRVSLIFSRQFSRLFLHLRRPFYPRFFLPAQLILQIILYIIFKDVSCEFDEFQVNTYDKMLYLRTTFWTRQAVVKGVNLSPPRRVPSFFIVQRVQPSHGSTEVPVFIFSLSKTQMDAIRIVAGVGWGGGEGGALSSCMAVVVWP